MSKDDIKPGEQLTLAQINRIRKQQQAAATGKAGNGGAKGGKKPTRADLDSALDELPGNQNDADYVVNGMRRHFGDLFTDDDEVRVREIVPAKAGKPSDGLKVEELREALEARGIEIPEGAKKADLQQLLDEAEGAG